MEDIQQIITVRHGQRYDEKKGGRLTPRGAAEIYAITELLVSMGIKFGLRVHSGAHRTCQSAIIADAVIEYETLLIELKEFHFQKLYNKFLGGSIRRYKAELKKIYQADGTVADALKISAYAENARIQVTKAIQNSAKLVLLGSAKMKRNRNVLVFSHGEFCNLAVPEHQMKKIPYTIGSGSAIIYNRSLKTGEIISAKYIENPLAK